MTPRRRFDTATRDLWPDLDAAQGSNWMESREEAEEYDREATHDIKRKLREISDVPLGSTRASGLQGDHSGPTFAPANSFIGNHLIGDDTSYHGRDNSPGSRSTPSGIPTGTLVPSVSTPSNATPRFPDPPPKPKSHIKHQPVLDTPAHIASPIDSPDARPRALEQQGTPVPIGSGTDALNRLKGKDDHKTLTRLFEEFNKDIAKSEAKVERAEKGKGGRSRATTKTGSVILGSKVFEGLRFCMPPELGQASKHKARWKIIAALGGQVTLQLDTATTHVIYEGSYASALCRDLGVRTLSDLPAGTICVKWDYVVRCKFEGRRLDPKLWFSFPENALTRKPTLRKTSTGTSRLSDITDQLKGKSTSITRKRPETASESDTESSKRPYRATTLRAASALLPKSAPKRQKSVIEPTTATVHDLPSGLGWEQAPSGYEDGLDAMISGVKNGTETEELEDSPEPGAPVEDDSNPDPRGDGWKCGQTHDGTANKGPNEAIAIMFDTMHDMYRGVQGKNQFAVRQYQQAASILRRTAYPITSGAQALRIKGIGKSIADRIDEFLSGEMGRLYYERTEQIQVVQQFKDIYGVGANLANELYRKGARSIDDLRAHDYGLTIGQLIGLELYEDLKTRIPREECRQIFELVRTEAEAIDPKIWIEIMGSYRRGQENSGDVDILITRNPEDGLTHAGVLQLLVRALQEKGIITHSLSLPHDWKALEAKWMGVCRVGPEGKYRRIDILCIPFEQWGAALIYFTGNEIFNRSLRLYARKKGYSLNQRGLSHGIIRGKDGLKQTEGEIIASRTEQDIFDVLGLRWRHPHHRRP